MACAAEIELLAQELEYERELELREARSGLMAFIMATKPEFQPWWHHRAVAHLVDVMAANGTVRDVLHRLGYDDPRIDREMQAPHEVTGLHLGMTNPAMLDEPLMNAQIWMSPRYGKSEVISRRTPAWILGRSPRAQIIATSYGADLAQQMNRDVQRIIDDDRFYAPIFPETTLAKSPLRKEVPGTFSRNADIFEVVGYKGFYKAAGVGGAIMGRGVSHDGYALVDDPFKSREQAESAIERLKVAAWYNSTLYSRLENGAKRLIMNTRWHHQDLSGVTIEKAKTDPDSEQYFVLSFPALLDCQPGPGDPRKQGEPLWPYRHSAKRLKQIRSTMGSYEFESLHQQRPSPLEGGVIKKAWWQFYDALPAGLGNWTLSVDLSFEDHGDPSAFQVWASVGARRYLVFQINERLGFTEQIAAFKQCLSRYPQCRTKLVEKKANGAALLNALAKVVQGLTPYNPTTSKTLRLMAASPQIEAGNVFLPSPRIAPWIDAYINEFSAFPTGAHDDQIDATSQFLIYAQQTSHNWNFTASSIKPDPQRPTYLPPRGNRPY